MKIRTTNRRLWSYPRVTGDKPFIEYASPITGPVRRVPTLSLIEANEHAREKLAMHLMGAGCPLATTVAREQLEGM